MQGSHSSCNHMKCRQKKSNWSEFPHLLHLNTRISIADSVSPSLCGSKERNDAQVEALHGAKCTAFLSILSLRFRRLIFLLLPFQLDVHWTHENVFRTVSPSVSRFYRQCAMTLPTFLGLRKLWVAADMSNIDGISNSMSASRTHSMTLRESLFLSIHFVCLLLIFFSCFSLFCFPRFYFVRCFFDCDFDFLYGHTKHFFCHFCCSIHLVLSLFLLTFQRVDFRCCFFSFCLNRFTIYCLVLLSHTSTPKGQRWTTFI